MRKPKILKVSNQPQGSGYVPGVKLCGQMMKENGFDLGERVRVEAQKDLIILTRIKGEAQQTVRQMIERNNELLKFIIEFDLCSE